MIGKEEKCIQIFVDKTEKIEFYRGFCEWEKIIIIEY